MTESASTPQELAKVLWLPGKPWSGKTKQLRQGDLLFGYHHQLRTEQDADGPGPASGASRKVPLLGEYEDRTIELNGARLTVRVWHGWMMVSRLIEIPHCCLSKFPTWLSVQHRPFWREGSVAASAARG